MKTLIGIPCMDMVPTPFMQSVLCMRYPPNSEITLASGSLIYDARNSIAKKAIKDGFDQVLWLDSDMIFEPDLLIRLQAHLDAGAEFVTGIYFARKKPIQPVIYESVSVTNEDGGYSAEITPYRQYPQDSVFEIEGCGFGCVMLKTSVIERVQATYGLPFFPGMGLGEDLAFCYRARELGIKIICDSSIKAKHIAYYPVSEETYQKGKF